MQSRQKNVLVKSNDIAVTYDLAIWCRTHSGNCEYGRGISWMEFHGWHFMDQGFEDGKLNWAVKVRGLANGSCVQSFPGMLH